MKNFDASPVLTTTFSSSGSMKEMALMMSASKDCMPSPESCRALMVAMKAMDFPRAPSTLTCGFDGSEREMPAVKRLAPG